MSEFNAQNEYKNQREENFSPGERVLPVERVTAPEGKTSKEFPAEKKEENANTNTNKIASKAQKAAKNLRLFLTLISVLTVATVGVVAVSGGGDAVVELASLSPSDTVIEAEFNVESELELKAVLENDFTIREQNISSEEPAVLFEELTPGMEYNLYVVERNDGTFSKKFFKQKVKTSLTPVEPTPTVNVELLDCGVDNNALYYSLRLVSGVNSVIAVLDNGFDRRTENVVFDEEGIYEGIMMDLAFGTYTLEIVELQGEEQITLLTEEFVLEESLPTAEVVLAEFGAVEAAVFYHINIISSDYPLIVVLEGENVYLTEDVVYDETTDPSFGGTFEGLEVGIYTFSIMELQDDGDVVVLTETVEVTVGVTS